MRAAGRAEISAVFVIMNLTIAHPGKRPANVLEVRDLLRYLVPAKQKIIRLRVDEFLTAPIAAMNSIGLCHDRSRKFVENLGMGMFGPRRLRSHLASATRRTHSMSLLIAHVHVQQEVFEFIRSKIIAGREQLASGSEERDCGPTVQVIARVDVGTHRVLDSERNKVGVEQCHIFALRKRLFVHALTVAAPKRRQKKHHRLILLVCFTKGILFPFEPMDEVGEICIGRKAQHQRVNITDLYGEEMAPLE